MMIDDKTRYFSNSELQTWKRCKRKWYLSSYLNLQRKNNEDEVIGPLGIGNRVHLGLQAYYDPQNPFDKEHALYVYDMSAQADEDRLWGVNEDGDPEFHPDIKQFHKDVELGRIMLEGYFDWVEEEGNDQDWEILGAEEVLQVELDKDILGDLLKNRPYEEVGLICAYDLRVRRQSDSARFFVDHKTVGNLTDLPKWAHIAPQFKHYALMSFIEQQRLGDEGERTDGGIYNMLRKVKRTKTANPPFYGRHEVRHNIHELRNYFTQMVGWVEEIVRTEQQLDDGFNHQWVAPPTPNGDCTWSCPYFGVCGMMDDGSDWEGLVEETFTNENDPFARYQKSQYNPS